MNFLPSPNDRLISPNCSLLSSQPLRLSGWLATALGTGFLLLPLGLSSPQAVAQDGSPLASPQTNGDQSGTKGYTVLVVNPVTGDDAAADGSDRAPFKTITRALQIAQPNSVIQLLPGTYSEETGERFPLQLKPGSIIQGNPETRGTDIVIRGSGYFLSPTSARQNVTILGAKQAALIGVTVTNPHPQGYGVWVESANPVVTDNTFTANGHDGVSIVGNSNPLIRNNFFYQNGANGITVYGTSRPELRENIFEQTGFAININQNAAPLIVGNRITQNKDGIVVQAKARPVLRNNSIENNERDGIVVIAQARPDLGLVGEPGGNFIRNNGQFDVNAKNARERMSAFGNELAKTAGDIDLTGAVATMPIAGTVTESPSGGMTAMGAASAGAVAISPTPEPPSGSLPIQPVTARTTVATTIPFGERLTPAVSGKPLASPPVAATAAIQSGSPATLSAASFPIPGNQPVRAPEQPTAVSSAVPAKPAPDLVATIPSQPFPVPTLLSGQGANPQPRRPIQIVRVTASETKTQPETKAPEAGSQTTAANFPAPRSAPSQPKSENVTPTASPEPKPRIYIPPKPKAPTNAAPVALNVSSATPPPVNSSGSPLRLVSPLPQNPASTGTTPASIAPSTTPSRAAISTAFPVPSALNGSGTTPSANRRSFMANPSLPVNSSLPTTADRPIEIPVPPPERAVVVQPVSNRLVQPVALTPAIPKAQPIAPPQLSQPGPVSLLPVPSPNVPLGNVGTSSATKVFGTSAQDGSGPPVPPDRVSMMGVRYRVLVEPDGDGQATKLRSLVPGAFPTSSRGRTVMQAGAFGDQEKANQLVQALLDQGIKAVVEKIE